jgi:hypothetical protein
MNKLRIQPAIKEEIEQATGKAIPEPSSPEFVGFLKELKTTHPDLARKLRTGVELEGLTPPKALQEQLRMGQARERKRNLLRTLFQRQGWQGKWIPDKRKILLLGLLGAFGMAALFVFTLSRPSVKAVTPGAVGMVGSTLNSQPSAEPSSAVPPGSRPPASRPETIGAPALTSPSATSGSQSSATPPSMPSTLSLNSSQPSRIAPPDMLSPPRAIAPAAPNPPLPQAPPPMPGYAPAMTYPKASEAPGPMIYAQQKAKASETQTSTPISPEPIIRYARPPRGQTNTPGQVQTNAPAQPQSTAQPTAMWIYQRKAEAGPVVVYRKAQQAQAEAKAEAKVQADSPILSEAQAEPKREVEVYRAPREDPSLVQFEREVPRGEVVVSRETPAPNPVSETKTAADTPKPDLTLFRREVKVQAPTKPAPVEEAERALTQYRKELPKISPPIAREREENPPVTLWSKTNQQAPALTGYQRVEDNKPVAAGDLIQSSQPNRPVLPQALAESADGLKTLYQRPAPKLPEAPTAPVQNPAPTIPSPTFQPGQQVEAKLATAVLTLEGGQVPVVAESEGAIWIGVASLDASRRVQVSFERVVQSGQAANLQAMALDAQGVPGLQAVLEEQAPSLASDMLRAAVNGVSTYVQGLASASSSTVLPGGGAVQNKEAPPLGLTLLGEIGKLFALPQGQASVVRLARVDKGTPILILVGVGARPGARP